MGISSLAALSAAAIFQHAIAADSAGPIWYQDTDGGDTIGPRGAQGSSSDGVLVLVNQSYFLEAYRRPNATMAVAFDLAGQEGWRWRVNVTDVHVPHAAKDSRRKDLLSPDAHIAATTYDLQWPYKALTLNESVEEIRAERGGGGEFCAVHLRYAYAWPNVTNAWRSGDEEVEGGSCEGLLPEGCRRAFANVAAALGEGCEVDEELVEESRWREECAGVWSLGSTGAEAEGLDIQRLQSGSSLDIGQSDGFVQYDYFPRNDSDGIWAEHSHAYEQSNETAIEQRKSRLRFMLLKFGDWHRPLCLRVDDAIDEWDVSPVRSQALERNATRGDGREESAGSAGVLRWPRGLLEILGFLALFVVGGLLLF